MSLAAGSPMSMGWVIWIGVVGLGIHVVLGFLLTGLDHMAHARGDESVEIGPMLWVRWATGVIMALCAFVHSGLFMRGPNGSLDVLGLQIPSLVVIVVFVLALAIHIVVSARKAIEDHVQHPAKPAGVIAIRVLATVLTAAILIASVAFFSTR